MKTITVGSHRVHTEQTVKQITILDYPHKKVITLDLPEGAEPDHLVNEYCRDHNINFFNDVEFMVHDREPKEVFYFIGDDDGGLNVQLVERQSDLTDLSRQVILEDIDNRFILPDEQQNFEKLNSMIVAAGRDPILIHAAFEFWKDNFAGHLDLYYTGSEPVLRHTESKMADD